MSKANERKVRPLRKKEREAVLTAGQYKCAECGEDTQELRSKVNDAFDRLSRSYSYRASRRDERYAIVAEGAGVALSIARAVLKDRRLPADVDHIVPRSEGGTNDASNLRVLCVECHRFKSADDASRLARLPTQRRFNAPE